MSDPASVAGEVGYPRAILQNCLNHVLFLQWLKSMICLDSTESAPVACRFCNTWAFYCSDFEWFRRLTFWFNCRLNKYTSIMDLAWSVLCISVNKIEETKEGEVNR